MLFRVMMTHYGPKDNETAIAYFVSAPSERAMIEGLDQKVTFYGCKRYAWEEVPEVDHAVLQLILGERFINLNKVVDAA